MLREPTLHFFVLGALLFAAHHLVAGEPRTIVVTPGVKADVARRFRDDNGRPPTAAERARALRDWQRDEALFRQALAEKLDQNDRAIRAILIDKLRARVVQQVPPREPTEPQLADWLKNHRGLYETPKRYALEWLSFSKAQASANQERAANEEKLKGGVDARSLGRPHFGARLTLEEVGDRLGAQVSSQVATLALGQWHESESPNELLLVRVDQVEGGLPPENELRPRLILDCAAALREQAAQKELDMLVAQYHFQERP
jgi:hypothetical protein